MILPLCHLTMEHCFIEDWHLITMVIFNCIVRKRRERLGLFHGKPFKHLVTFLVLVGPTVIGSSRKCSCLPEYKMKNRSDWAYGCEPQFHLSCNKNESKFQLLLSFTGMILGSSSITPSTIVRIYAWNHLIAKHSNTPFAMVIQFVILRCYCWMDLIIQI